MKLFKNKTFLLFLPSLVFLIIPLYGLFGTIKQSLFQDGALSLSYYEQLWLSDRFIASLGFSLNIAFLSSLLSLGIGLFITRSCYGYLEKTIPRIIVWIPMLFPHFVWGYMVVLLLSETGVLSHALLSLGWLSDNSQFPILTRDPKGIGIIITYVWKETPFVILMLLPVYASVDPSYYDVVKTLGGGRWQQFINVEWPHLNKVLMETFIIIFSFVIASYEVPAFLGTSYPEMVAIVSYDWFYDGNWEDRPLAFAAMVSISLFILILAMTGFMLVNKKTWRSRRK
ncbi:ABC transporter permease [Halobacillus litoralis]|uniref:ABC transporter permease n=1 Tax=Halobacillus litoralis TaxID=45668 RepID=UPI00248FC0A5|nr:ABC transporter permease subunit [Halobacillus litoralis]